MTSGDLQVFGSFHAANIQLPTDAVATAMERMGIEVQELDI